MDLEKREDWECQVLKDHKVHWEQLDLQGKTASQDLKGPRERWEKWDLPALLERADQVDLVARLVTLDLWDQWAQAVLLV